jgi:hypothetical protein
MEEIRVVMLEARPLPDSPDFGEVAGAFVNVYCTADTDATALNLASSEITQQGWVVLSVEGQHVMSRSEAQSSPDTLAYYEQTLIDGVVLVFHNFPHGGEEPEPVH